MELPYSLSQLIESFSKLPGIGEKSATRMALQILNWDGDKILDFAKAFEGVINLGQCEKCFVWSDHTTCGICKDEKRKSMINKYANN